MDLIRSGRNESTIWFFVVFLFFSVTSLIPSLLEASDEYEQLKNKLKSDQPIDTQLVESLQEPSNAEQYYLRAQVRDRFPAALEDFDRALALRNGTSDTLVRDWLELALLADSSPERLDRLKELLEQSPSEYGGEVWLLSGKFAAYHNNFDRAIRWTDRALQSNSPRTEVLLDRAYYQLQAGRAERARRTLDRFLLEDTGSFRPRYWNLRGQAFQKVGSDSEAYIAHNQVIRHYPDSLEISEAESRLSDIPLPEVFKPSETGSLSTNLASDSDQQSRKESANPSPAEDGWKIQIGSFQKRERAESFRRRMKSRLDQDLTITRAMVDGRRYFRVRITVIPSRREASRRAEGLKNQGIDSFVIN